MAAFVAVAAMSCRSSDGSAGMTAIEFETGLFTLVGDDAPRGGEARLRLRSAKGVETINIVIAQIDYDSTRLRLKGCEIDRAVAEGTLAGKHLLSLEQSPGTVRTIVTGSVEPIPGDADIFSCSFKIAPEAPAGPIQIRVEGDASDTDFVDHAFREELHLVVKE
jgi:hypothetical protein